MARRDVMAPGPHRSYRAKVWESFVLGSNDKRIPVELPLLHP